MLFAKSDPIRLHFTVRRGVPARPTGGPPLQHPRNPPGRLQVAHADAAHRAQARQGHRHLAAHPGHPLQARHRHQRLPHRLHLRPRAAPRLLAAKVKARSYSRRISTGSFFTTRKL